METSHRHPYPTKRSGTFRVTQSHTDSNPIPQEKYGDSENGNRKNHQGRRGYPSTTALKNDDRDDETVIETEQQAQGSLTSTGVPADFSKKELAQLARSKQRRTQEQAIAPVAGVNQKTAHKQQTNRRVGASDKSNEGTHWGSADAFLDARAKARKSDKGSCIDNPRALDGLLLAMLPNSIWLTDFLNESRGAIRAIQKRELLQYEDSTRL